jgi:TIR domain/NB-ARC domain
MPNETKSYDVFLSHAHVDAEFVKKLADSLVDEHGLKVWLDQWVLVPGDLWQHDMAEGINDAASCAVCIGGKTPEGWFKQEIQRALNRQSREPKFRVIPLILPGGDTSNVDNFLELRTWVDMRKGLDDEEGMHKLVRGIQGIQPGRIATKTTSSSPLFTIPLPDNPFFTERGNELAELEELLNKRGIAAITGMGGMGKTQTASKYAYLHRDDYPAILWVRAENEETLIADFTRLAALLNLPESTAQEQKLVIEAVKRWLDEQPRWLLVLDNVVDLKFVSELTRKADAKGRHILVTTQSQSTGAIRSKDLPLMDNEMGALLLLRRAGLIGPDAPMAEAKPEDVKTAKGISEKLGGLPLALDQAGAYISETDWGLEDYRELLSENLPELLARRSR